LSLAWTALVTSVQRSQLSRTQLRTVGEAQWAAYGAKVLLKGRKCWGKRHILVPELSCERPGRIIDSSWKQGGAELTSAESLEVGAAANTTWRDVHSHVLSGVVGAFRCHQRPCASPTQYFFLTLASFPRGEL